MKSSMCVFTQNALPFNFPLPSPICLFSYLEISTVETKCSNLCRSCKASHLVGGSKKEWEGMGKDMLYVYVLEKYIEQKHVILILMLL